MYLCPSLLRRVEHRYGASIMILKTENGPLYYEVEGEGLPLVFISGWAMSGECWRPVFDLLKPSYRCLLYDRRGMGRSQPVAAEATFHIEDHAEDLHKLLDREGLYNAVFIAHEMGALIAVACAKAHPQDIAATVFVSPRTSFSKDEMKSLGFFTPASLVLRDIASFPVIRNLVALRFSNAPQPYRDRLFDDFAELSPRSAYEMALSASEQYETQPVEAMVKSATAPVLFICGEDDKKGSHQARHLFETARAGKLATLTDCGFLPMLEYANQVARLIEDFAKNAEKAGKQLLSFR